jgi:eukaryotic-like serine/threonine-protein kinase
MKFFKAESLKDVLIHVAIIFGIFVSLILIFFYYYLPSATKHGEYITVPKLEGMTVDQIKEVLEEKNLRYEISDSTYKVNVKPFTVLSQHPEAGNEVKENRRIYVSIAAKNPPNIKMPDLIDQSVRGAEMQLKSLGLQVGTITTTPNPANVVLKQSYQGGTIKQGTSIPKGSKIDLLVGSGRGETEMEVPNVTGMTLEEAIHAIEAMGLVVGTQSYDPSSDKPEGTILKQKPTYQIGVKVRSGDVIDLWISGSE